MHCVSCGKAEEFIHLRCSACGSLTPALWLNLYSLLIWLMIAVVHVTYFLWIVPSILKIYEQFNEMLPLIVRLHYILADFIEVWGPWIILLSIIAGLAMWWKKVKLPKFCMSGKLFAGITYLALGVTFTGILYGLVALLLLFPKIAFLLRSQQ